MLWPESSYMQIMKMSVKDFYDKLIHNLISHEEAMMEDFFKNSKMAKLYFK